MIEIQNTNNSTSLCDVHQNDRLQSSGMSCLTETNEGFHQDIHNTSDETQDSVPHQGLLDRKFEILYNRKYVMIVIQVLPQLKSCRPTSVKKNLIKLFVPLKIKGCCYL